MEMMSNFKNREKKMEIKSPLEELSQAYLCQGPHSLLDSWEQKILDDTKNETLYIVPAGFSQRNREGRQRTIYYKAAYQKAVNFNTEKKLNPFGVKSHAVILKPEPQNPYDKNAIRIGVRFDDFNKTPQWFKPQLWQDIGYVPQAISGLLKKNFKMLRNGNILSVHALLDKDLYFARIAIPYGKPIESLPLSKCDSKRFKNILEE